MSHWDTHELLDDLRGYLMHFERTGDLGESETIAEIQRRLRDQIAEIEAELKRAER